MKKILEGIQRFQKGSFKKHETLFNQLKEGQQPLALFITCSDSRIDPSLITHTKPGELFIMRNAGNIVPPFGAARSGEIATIEYAVNVLEVDDIIICGHSHCGAMAGKLAPESLEQLPAVRDWLVHAEDSRSIVPEKYGHITSEEDLLMVAVEENIFVQLEHLCSHPSVSLALSKNKLQLHGWVYQFETGQVYEYDNTKRGFFPIDGSVD